MILVLGITQPHSYKNRTANDITRCNKTKQLPQEEFRVAEKFNTEYVSVISSFNMKKEIMAKSKLQKNQIGTIIGPKTTRYKNEDTYVVIRRNGKSIVRPISLIVKE